MLPRLQAWYRRSGKRFWKLIVVKAAMWRRLQPRRFQASLYAEGLPGFPIGDWSSEKTGLVIRFDLGALLRPNVPV
jgi:hypothetical protein